MDKCREEVDCGGCWHTGYAAIGVDAFVWFFLEVFELDPAGFVG